MVLGSETLGRNGKWRLLPLVSRGGRQECVGFPGPGDSAGLSSRRLAFCCGLSIFGEAPDRKDQVSWKAPLGLDSLPPQGGPTPKNEHLLMGLLGKSTGRRLLQSEAGSGPFWSRQCLK